MPPARAPLRYGWILPLLGILAASMAGEAEAAEGAVLSARWEEAAKSGRRPVVGVALSGGGARGFAHIGVLKALEELRIPVDRLAGTSMGAVVGGLSACGYRASEIEGIILGVDWDDIFRDAAPRSRRALFDRQESSRYLISLPMEGLRIRVPTGVTEGDKVTNVLSLLTVIASGSRSFDDLPVPFRAVATDLATGERVALASGSLPEAIRASLSFPLVFTPVEVEGRLLVDGGLSDNLPVDVTREMGADILIASDVSSPLRGRTELDSPLGVGDQAMSIPIVANARKMRELADAAIAPPLLGVTPADFDRTREVIRAGYDAAMANPELRQIASSLSSWNPPPPPSRPAPVISNLRVEGTDRYNQKRLQEAAEALAGRPLDPTRLREELDRVLNDQYFDQMKLHLAPVPGREPELVVTVSEKRSNAFNFSGRFDDKYGVLGLVNVTFRDLGGGNNLASLDLQGGSFSRFSGELLVPSVPGTAFFFRPQVFWTNDFQLAYAAAGGPAEFVDRRWGGEIPAGNTFRNLGAVTLGYRFASVDFHLRSGEEILQPFQGHVASLVLRSHVDTLDRSSLPDRGRLVDFVFEAARPGLGGDVEFDRARLDYSGYLTWRRRHTLSTGLHLATSFSGDLPVLEQFRLGGEDYLVGLRREEIRGNHAAGVRAGYRFLLADLGNAFFSRLYLEVGADAANAWLDRDRLEGGLIRDATISFQARTWVGPLRINLGLAEGGRTNATLSIGHRF